MGNNLDKLRERAFQLRSEKPSRLNEMRARARELSGEPYDPVPDTVRRGRFSTPEDKPPPVSAPPPKFAYTPRGAVPLPATIAKAGEYLSGLLPEFEQGDPGKYIRTDEQGNVRPLTSQEEAYGKRGVLGQLGQDLGRVGTGVAKMGIGMVSGAPLAIRNILLGGEGTNQAQEASGLIEGMAQPVMDLPQQAYHHATTPLRMMGIDASVHPFDEQGYKEAVQRGYDDPAEGIVTAGMLGAGVKKIGSKVPSGQMLKDGAVATGVESGIPLSVPFEQRLLGSPLSGRGGYTPRPETRAPMKLGRKGELNYGHQKLTTEDINVKLRERKALQGQRQAPTPETKIYDDPSVYKGQPKSGISRTAQEVNRGETQWNTKQELSSAEKSMQTFLGAENLRRSPLGRSGLSKQLMAEEKAAQGLATQKPHKSAIESAKAIEDALGKHKATLQSDKGRSGLSKQLMAEEKAAQGLATQKPHKSAIESAKAIEDALGKHKATLQSDKGRSLLREKMIKAAKIGGVAGGGATGVGVAMHYMTEKEIGETLQAGAGLALIAGTAGIGIKGALSKTKDAWKYVKSTKTGKNFGAFKEGTKAQKYRGGMQNVPEAKQGLNDILSATEKEFSLTAQFNDDLAKTGRVFRTRTQRVVDKVKKRDIPSLNEMSKRLQDGLEPEVAGVLKNIRDKATNVGVKMGDVSHYFPRVLKSKVAEAIYDDLTPIIRELNKRADKGLNISDYVMRDRFAQINASTKKLLDHVVNTGQAKTRGQAARLLDDAIASDSHLYNYSGFTKPRKLKLPSSVYDTDINRVLARYTRSMAKDIAATEKFGVNGVKFKARLDALEKVDGIAARELLNSYHTFTGEAFKGMRLTGPSKQITDVFTATEFGTKILLGTSTVPNLTQTFISTLDLGAGNTVRGALRLLTPQGRKAVKRSGAINQHLMTGQMGLELEGLTGRVIGEIGRYHPFTGVNKLNSSLAATTFEAWAKDMYKIANRKSWQSKIPDRVKYARQRLDDFQIDYKQKLTDDLLGEKMYRFATDSQLQRNMLNDPRWTNNPYVKPLFLFKRFGLRQAMWQKDNFVREFKRAYQESRAGGSGVAKAVGKSAMRGSLRNVVPVLRLAAGGYFGGEFVIWAKGHIKALLTGEEYKDRKSDQFSLQRFGENYGAVGVIGVLSDMATAGDFSSQAWFTVLPVAASDLWNTFDLAGSALKREFNTEAFGQMAGTLPKYAIRGYQNKTSYPKKKKKRDKPNLTVKKKKKPNIGR